jgi:hypothetical protein
VTFNGAVSPQMSLALDAFRNNGLLPFSEEHARETLAIYASLRRTAWEAAMEVLYETCCGLDVHKSSITAIHLVLLQAVLRTPRPDDCVSGWALIRPSDNWQHRLLFPTPIGTEPEPLIQSANRNTVEKNNADESQQNDIRDKTL